MNSQEKLKRVRQLNKRIYACKLLKRNLTALKDSVVAEVKYWNFYSLYESEVQNDDVYKAIDADTKIRKLKEGLCKIKAKISSYNFKIMEDKTERNRIVINNAFTLLRLVLKDLAEGGR